MSDAKGPTLAASAPELRAKAEALDALAARDNSCIIMGPGLIGTGWICTVDGKSGHGPDLAAAIMDALRKAGT